MTIITHFQFNADDHNLMALCCRSLPNAIREQAGSDIMDRGDSGNLKEGMRLLCEDCFGTVRYVGEVPPTEGKRFCHYFGRVMHGA